MTELTERIEPKKESTLKRIRKKFFKKVNLSRKGKIDIKIFKRLHKPTFSKVTPKFSKLKIRNQVFAIMMLIILLTLGLSFVSTSRILDHELQSINLGIMSERNEKNINLLGSKLNAVLEVMVLMTNQQNIKSMVDEVNSTLIIDRIRYKDIFNTLDNLSQSSNGLYRSIYIADKYGNVIAADKSTEKSGKMVMVSNKEYFKDLNIDTKNTIGRPLVEGEDILIPFSYVIENNGKKIGALVILFDRVKLLEGIVGNVAILDKFGNHVYHWDSDLILKHEEYLTDDSLHAYTIGNTDYLYKMNEFSDYKWSVASFITEKDLYSSQTKLKMSIILLGIGTIVVSGLLIMFFSKLISDPINKISKSIESLSKGDLSTDIDVHSSYEIDNLSRSFKNLVTSLNNISGSLYTTNEGIEVTSQELEDLSISITESTKKSSQSLETVVENIRHDRENLVESVTAINTISEKIEDISRSSSEIDELISKTSEENINVYRQLDLVSDNSSISIDTSNNLVNVVDDLLLSITTIGSINTTISEISRKTRLLSLNAAIEAARAGQHGSGFSVVAGEIKGLSDLISKESTDIAKIIKDLGRKSEDVERHTSNNEKAIIKQTQAVENMKNSYHEISKKLGESGVKVKDIKLMIEKLSEEKKQLIEAIGYLDTSSQKSSKEVDNLAKLVSEHSEVVNKLEKSSKSLSDGVMENVEVLNFFCVS